MYLSKAEIKLIIKVRSKVKSAAPRALASDLGYLKPVFFLDRMPGAGLSCIHIFLESQKTEVLVLRSEQSIQSASQITSFFLHKLMGSIGGLEIPRSALSKAIDFFGGFQHQEGRELAESIIFLAARDTNTQLDSLPRFEQLRELHERIQEYLFLEELRLGNPSSDFKDVHVQQAIASMYDNGDGVAKNHFKALIWYEMAAKQGSSSAIFNIGVMHLKGEGVPKNSLRAAEYFLKAAEMGNAGAASMYGSMFAAGQGVQQDLKKAAKWLAVAALGGDAHAQGQLGHLYATGSGVELDYTEALAWTYLAAQGGSRNAENNLVNMKIQLHAEIQKGALRRGAELAKSIRERATTR